MKIIEKDNSIILTDADRLDLSQTLDCGQSFRWSEASPGTFCGIAGGKLREVSQNGREIIFHNTDKAEFENFFVPYFDLSRNYSEIVEALSQNDIFGRACTVAGGIHILRQDPWETLCSFIISQNNNIPRIKGIIERLCESFGQKTDGGYTFPDASVIAGLSVEDLAPIRSGFRAKYIIDGARRFADGEIDTGLISRGSADEGRAELMKIYGVGEKVADCTLLFAFSKIEAFPKDVWIKRAMAKLFNGELPACAIPYAGIAQQYLFHFARITRLDV